MDSRCQIPHETTRNPRASGIPFDALPRSQMKVAVAEVDADKQFIALNYLKAVAPPNAA